MYRWIIIIASLAFSTCVQSKIEIGENIHVSHEWAKFPHAEVHLAVNPDKNDHMLAAAFAYKGNGGKDYPAVYISNDGGNTWKRIDIKSPNTGAADPWVIFQKNRIVYVHTSGMVHISEDQGKTWTSKRVITKESGNRLDFIKVVGKENDEEFYAVATNNLPTANGSSIDPVTVFKINKELQVEDSIHILPDSINYKNGIPVIARESLMIVPFYELLDRNRNLLDDYPIWLAHVDLKNFEIVELIKTPLSGGEISMTIDPTSERIHLINPTNVEEAFKLSYAYSDDLGRTWSEPKLIEDFERGSGSIILTASISVTNTSIVGIMWPDHRTDPSNEAYGMYFMYSKDGGKTFSKSYLISEISSPKTDKNMSTLIGDSNRPVGDRFWVGGDYYGLAPIVDNSFQAAWVDSRTGVAQVWTTRINIR